MEDIIYKNALAEVEEILKYTDENLLEKIPSNIKKFITENKNKEYKVQITQEKTLEQQEILPETKAILAILYRDYWATSEEKEEIAKQDAIQLEKEEQRKKELYPSDVFEKRNNNVSEIKEEKQITDITIIPETKWYQKIWNKITKIIFRKK